MAQQNVYFQNNQYIVKKLIVCCKNWVQCRKSFPWLIDWLKFDDKHIESICYQCRQSFSMHATITELCFKSDKFNNKPISSELKDKSPFQLHKFLAAIWLFIYRDYCLRLLFSTFAHLKLVKKSQINSKHSTKYVVTNNKLQKMQLLKIFSAKWEISFGKAVQKTFGS